MSNPATTPNPSDNPFDTPLPSEMKEHQQASAATVASGGNPFDDLLPSEKTEQLHQEVMKQNPANNFSSGSKVPNAILNGSDTTGDVIGGLTLAGSAALAASPIVDAAVAHLGGLTKIVQAAKNLGWASFGLKEAHDLYKMVSGDKK